MKTVNISSLSPQELDTVIDAECDSTDTEILPLTDEEIDELLSELEDDTGEQP